MKYTKMHGAGNDFIIINNIVEEIPEESFSDIAKTLCKRRTSIGADGIMFIDHPEGCGDFRMHFYNADGTEGEMCGNGARCICRYAHENGLSGEKQKVETISGVVRGWRIDKRTFKVRLNSPTHFIDQLELKLHNQVYKCSYVELGSPGLPHLLLEMPGLNNIDEAELFKIGKGLRSHPSLAKGANVNFFDIDEEGNIIARTFERGVEDFTLACGTGAGSLGYVLVKEEMISGNQVTINMPGGELTIQVVLSLDWMEDIFLSGPATMVSEGLVLDEDLRF
ncbi:diaminopimelate epimerase [Gudongella sp. DL1XJH-153]|uniref:diaminopimelate epimerase n=1 Tax=Gudongella sp. DL1XJH-153 TaxID=3409804 RepID=UPI003BB71AE3